MNKIASLLAAAFLAALPACAAPDGNTAPDASPVMETVTVSVTDSVTGADADTPADPAQLVDPFVGTAGDHGQLAPAASVPFGLVQVGPDTDLRQHAGYDYRRDLVRGFSHTRFGGVGCSGAGGDVRLAPGLGAVPSMGYVIAIDKESEVATPGAYAVTLATEPPIEAAVTATTHCALHRYRFPASDDAWVFVHLTDPFHLPATGSWETTGEGDALQGTVTGATVCGKGSYALRFHLASEPSFASAETSFGYPGTGDNAVLHYAFAEPTELLVRVCLAGGDADVSAAAAYASDELAGLDFSEVQAAAAEAWRTALAVVEIPPEAEAAGLFTTMLFRALQSPMDLSAADGYRRLHGWSLWDTYRTKLPLQFLLAEGRRRDIALSVRDLLASGPPAWATDDEPCPTVRNEHALVVLLDALEKGLLDDEDVAPWWDDMTAVFDTFTYASPDQKLESAYDWWAAARIASRLGRSEEAQTYAAQAAAWRAVWDETFAEPGEDGDVMHGAGLYEGTVWQYRWAPVFALPELIAADGGESAFRANLDRFFDGELFNLGNEPDLHAPFLYAHTATPWKLQEVIGTILHGEMRHWYGTHEKWTTPEERPAFSPEPEGLLPEMDDDGGTMAAWYVWAALGLYPVTVGEPSYALGAPLFETITLHLRAADGTSRDFVIEAPGAGPENRFIHRATLNGEDLPTPWLTHEQLTAGGTLHLTLADAPNEAFGVE